MRARLQLAAATFASAALIATPAAGAQVMRWGTYFGGGGEGGGFTQPLPTDVPGLEEGVVALAASNSASYALKDGAVFAFGDGGGDELGDGTEKDATAPVRVSFPAGVSIVAIGEAKDAGFAIDSTGQGWAWGGNGEGELCLGKGAPKKVATPLKIPGLTHARAVAGGGNHVVWLMSDGTVEACGTNERGQLGVGEGVSKSAVPVNVRGLDERRRNLRGQPVLGGTRFLGSCLHVGRQRSRPGRGWRRNRRRLRALPRPAPGSRQRGLLRR